MFLLQWMTSSSRAPILLHLSTSFLEPLLLDTSLVLCFRFIIGELHFLIPNFFVVQI
jgi:hypothetical protein